MERLSLNGPNSFAIAATIAAYTKEDSEQWLADVNAYVDEKRCICKSMYPTIFTRSNYIPKTGNLFVMGRCACLL